MSRLLEAEFVPVDAEKLELMATFSAAEAALHAQGAQIRQATEVLGALSQEPTEDVWLTAAAEVATGEDGSAATALDVLPMIQSAAEPYAPKQLDSARPRSERWTQDWRAVTAALKERIDAVPQLGERLTNWFMTTGRTMVETTYPEADAEQPLKVVVPGANDQCSFRAILALASMASEEYRATHGMVTRPDATLKGEDGREGGWLKDDVFVAELRQHVAERIHAGEVTPRILVGGSGSRVLKEKELGVVGKYLDLSDDARQLYPELGWTEADAMLAGAMRVFGRANDASPSVAEFPAADVDQPPTRLVTFESLVGPVTFIATTGSDSNFRGQLKQAYALRPDLFSGADAMHGLTTAIYTWGQQPALLEAAALSGLGEADVQTFGISAHAAGIDRNLGTLVGELTNYLKAVYGLATRSIEAAERNAQRDLEMRTTLGDIALDTTVRAPWRRFVQLWTAARQRRTEAS